MAFRPLFNLCSTYMYMYMYLLTRTAGRRASMLTN